MTVGKIRISQLNEWLSDENPNSLMNQMNLNYPLLTPFSPPICLFCVERRQANGADTDQDWPLLSYSIHEFKRCT